MYWSTFQPGVTGTNPTRLTGIPSGFDLTGGQWERGNAVASRGGGGCLQDGLLRFPFCHITGICYPAPRHFFPRHLIFATCVTGVKSSEHSSAKNQNRPSFGGCPSSCTIAQDYCKVLSTPGIPCYPTIPPCSVLDDRFPPVWGARKGCPGAGVAGSHEGRGPHPPPMPSLDTSPIRSTGTSTLLPLRAVPYCFIARPAISVLERENAVRV